MKRKDGKPKAMQCNNNTGLVGVTWEPERRKFKAYIWIDSKLKYLGRHACLLDAVAARFRAERGEREEEGGSIDPQKVWFNSTQ